MPREGDRGAAQVCNAEHLGQMSTCLHNPIILVTFLWGFHRAHRVLQPQLFPGGASSSTWNQRTEESKHWVPVPTHCQPLGRDRIHSTYDQLGSPSLVHSPGDHDWLDKWTVPKSWVQGSKTPPAVNLLFPLLPVSHLRVYNLLSIDYLIFQVQWSVQVRFRESKVSLMVKETNCCSFPSFIKV